MSRCFARWLQRRWYGGKPPLLLRPLSYLYGHIIRVRRQRTRPAVLALPVIIVGNISVGGTGKTPLVIWLVEQLRAWGLRPGVIARGYGGRAPMFPLRVDASSDPAHCGDEALLIALRTGVPVAVAPDRVAAAQLLIDDADIDVLVSDDGLQHHRLPRRVEFCVVDGRRGLGNAALLPAGPLRETARRLAEVDRVIVNGEGFDAGVDVVSMELIAETPRRLVDSAMRELFEFRIGAVHAVAGIGDPERFFHRLEEAGISIRRHAFPDHHRFMPRDLCFDDALPVLMTEKDAVKCRRFAQPHWWYLPVSAVLSRADAERMRESCKPLLP